MKETLKFRFTPVDAPTPLDPPNPHVQATTRMPEIVEAINAQFGGGVEEVTEYAGETTVRVAKDHLVEVCRFLRDQHSFTYLSDIGGIDRFTEEDRYEVFYNAISMQNAKRIRLKVRVDENEMTVPTVTGVWMSASWPERETYDMFGIRFDGHPDLRRMYMPEDFEYYPLRKEFPLLGIPGSLPLPAQTPGGDLNYDPFPAAHGSPTVKSYQEAREVEGGEE